MKRNPAAFYGAALGLLLAMPASAQGTDITDPAEGWDILWKELLIDITLIGVIFFAAAVYMLIKYKAKNPQDVGTAAKLTLGQAIAWALIPSAIFLADDFYLAAKGWSVWAVQRTPPENAMEIKVTGYQWYWEFEYENGVITEELKVPVGQPIVMRMTSEDVIHGFGLPHYRVTEDMMPGRVTYLWFNPKEPVETIVTCREFCGAAHSAMYTSVSAVPRDEFDAWLAREKAEASLNTNDTAKADS